MSKFIQSVRFAWSAGLIFSILLFVPGGVYSQEDKKEEDQEEPEEVNISDNSFLVEEAYNQESGVVQHIFNWVPAWEHGYNANRTFTFLFTQEWPLFSQQHQISYSMPLIHYVNVPPNIDQGEAAGLGDIMLNYRYQLLNDEKGKNIVACAPRFSLIFPSGDPDNGLGSGKLGYQFCVPVSKTFKHWAFHFNAGLTQAPGVTAGVNPDFPFDGQNLDGYNFAASAIYFLRPNFHLMLEQTNTWTSQLLAHGEKDNQFFCVVNPGFRWAPYTKGDTQWVLGLALPIGVTEDAPDISAFFYMSFEHRFLKKSGGD
jgi:hypothetical protein